MKVAVYGKADGNNSASSSVLVGALDLCCQSASRASDNTALDRGVVVLLHFLAVWVSTVLLKMCKAGWVLTVDLRGFFRKNSWIAPMISLNLVSLHASNAFSVQSSVPLVKSPANCPQDNIVYGMGRTKASAEGHCAEDGRLHEDQSNYSYVAEEDEKISHSNGKPSVRSSQEDEDDGSDFEIQDVKVCDICGDAGREDMLAICSRCSDGAEHTYCMRDMLDKVPDGNWLCEECKFNEETEKQKRGPSEVLVDNGKNKFLGRSSFGNSDPSEFDNTDTHTDQSKINNLILHKELENKRIGDNIEVTATAKKLSVESNVASGTYSPGRTVLSRDNSFKSSDKVKTKQPPQLSSGYSSANDSSETVRSPVSNSVQAVHKGIPPRLMQPTYDGYTSFDCYKPVGYCNDSQSYLTILESPLGLQVFFRRRIPSALLTPNQKSNW
ncbi:hypothetical protein Dimus_000007 [Dionaea muscipula]